MSLTKQVHVYSVATDGFYTDEEQYIHKRLLKLYKLRNTGKDKKRKRQKKKELPKWKIASINRVIKKEKQKLSALLDERLKDSTPRELQESALTDMNVISLFESALTRALGLKPNELTKDLFVLSIYFFQVFENVVRDGFVYNGERYIFLTASAGQIRTKKAVFIKESAYKKIEGKLTCGLTREKINEKGGINPNKFLAYSALNSSATDPWPEFDIDKAIVVDDYESLVHGVVDYIDDVTYEIKRQEMDVPINQTDGMGLMLDGPTRMCRLAWIKGLMVQFPFDEFIREHCPEEDCTVYDIYGKPHKIIAEGIRYIFTSSQFKAGKYYDSWDEYKYYFKLYNCEACYCNIEEEYIPKARINYQMLQTLSDMTDAEIEKLVAPTIQEIDSIGQDFKTTMSILGATEYNTNPTWFQEALMIYPELFRDPYSREVLKDTKRSLIKQAKAGRLRVNGRYRFVCPDLVAFAQWLFLGELHPKGLLANGEVYVNEFDDGDELACLRSPHLYREWPIRENRRSQELDRWFGRTQCVYVSVFDLISRILQFD